MIYRPNLFLLFTNFFLFKNVIRISIFCLTIRPPQFHADQVEVSWQVIRICLSISTDIIGYANKVSCWPGTTGTCGTSGTNFLGTSGTSGTSGTRHSNCFLACNTNVANKVWVDQHRNSVGNKKPPISRWLILLVLNNVPHFIQSKLYYTLK